MVYITRTDLELRYGTVEILQLSDRNSDGFIDAMLIETAIADAESMVNRILSRKVIVPISTPTDELKRILSDIVRFYLYQNEAPAHIQSNYDTAMIWLNGIITGETSVDALSVGISTTGVVFRKNRASVFNDEALIGF